MANKINHRRKNKLKVDRRYPSDQYHNGYARHDSKATYNDGELIYPDGVSEAQIHDNGRVGRSGYLDKSMHGRKCQVSIIADRSIGASIGNDFSNGHRGMANAVRGAKKYVRTRVRFHENDQTRKLMKEYEID